MQEIKRYIDQLLSDINSITLDMSADNVITKIYGGKGINEDDVIIPRKVSIAEISAIKSCELPEEKFLNEEIASKIVPGITKVLKSVNIIPDFPLNLPEITKYGLFRDYWNTEFTISNKEHHIDFCHYHPDNCPYTQYCKICIEMNDED